MTAKDVLISKNLRTDCNNKTAVNYYLILAIKYVFLEFSLNSSLVLAGLSYYLNWIKRWNVSKKIDCPFQGLWLLYFNKNFYKILNWAVSKQSLTSVPIVIMGIKKNENNTHFKFHTSASLFCIYLHQERLKMNIWKPRIYIRTENIEEL